MIDTEELEDLKEEVRKNIGAVKNHCPYGCPSSALDEHGYCRHFVGFTNGSKVGDPVEAVVTNPLTEMCMVNGLHKRKRKTYRGKGADRQEFDVIPPSKQLVREGDELVNPEERQLVNGVYRVAKKWVSSRVYRRDPGERQTAPSQQSYATEPVVPQHPPKLVAQALQFGMSQAMIDGMATVSLYDMVNLFLERDRELLKSLVSPKAQTTEQEEEPSTERLDVDGGETK